MKRFLIPLLSAAVLTVGAGTRLCFAFANEQEVNDIWWSLYDDYNGSDRPACVAENYNEHPVDAVFEVFPASYDFDGNPQPSQMVVTLAPYQTTTLFSWANGAGPGAHCDLRSYTVHVP